MLQRGQTGQFHILIVPVHEAKKPTMFHPPLSNVYTHPYSHTHTDTPILTHTHTHTHNHTHTTPTHAHTHTHTHTLHPSVLQEGYCGEPQPHCVCCSLYLPCGGGEIKLIGVSK